MLVVEDNPINQEVAVSILAILGERADVVPSGTEAVELLGKKSYGLVFMDCELPEMSGFEAVARIRAEEARSRRKPVPVVALTAHALQGYRERCLAAGMSDYLAKPVKRSDIATMLARWLPAVGVRTSNEAGPAALDTAGAGESAGTERKPSPQVFDRTVLKRLVGADSAWANRLINRFLDDVPSRIRDLKASAERLELDGVRMLAHRIKGMALTIGGIELQTVASAAEVAAESGNVGGLAASIAKLEESYEALEAVLRAELAGS